MKKAFGIITLILMLSAMQLTASAKISISARHTDGENNAISHEIYVKADVEVPNANTMIVIRNDLSEIIEVDQGYSNDSGAVIFSFRCDVPGEYHGIINTEEKRKIQSFEFVIPTNYADIIDKFKNADENSIADVIDETKDMILFDTRYYTEETKDKIARKMLDARNGMNISNITERFDKSVIAAYLYNDFSNEIKQEIISYYDPLYFNMLDDEKTKRLYECYLNDFSQQQKNKVYEKLERSDPELSEFKDAFKEAVIMTAFDLSNTENLDRFVCENNDIIKLDGYEDKTQTKRGKALDYIRNKEPKNIKDINDAYKDWIKSEQTAAGGASQGGSSSGGGNGSGSGSGSSGNSSQKKPQSVVWVKPNINENTDENKDVQQTAQIKAFSDLDEVEWAKAAIEELYNKGIVNGRGNGIFAPKDNVTRAEFTTMVVNAFLSADDNAICDFSDVSKDDWSYKYIATAYSKGIITGYENGEFKKNENISREDMAVIIYRALAFTQNIPDIDKVTNNIADFKDVADYAKNSVLMLSSLKIMNGVGNGNILPKNNATRAEVAVMINNAMGVIGK